MLGLAALLAAGTGSMAAPHEIAASGWPLAVHVVARDGLCRHVRDRCRPRRRCSRCRTRRCAASRSGGWLATLPPVESLERALFSGICDRHALPHGRDTRGPFFVTNLFAQHLIHKIVLAIVAWAIFACLLFGRWRFGWRGRKAARYTIAGFVVLALAYFGSKFVLEILLGRHWG